MNRYIIGSLWDRNNRNGANANFEYLFEGRQKIDELNIRANDVLNEARQANEMNKNVQNQIDDLILSSGESDAEVIQARGGLPLLKDRLDRTDVQLADTASKMNTEIISSKRRKAMISIIDDDCFTQVITNWEPILKEKDFKLNIAAITNQVGTADYKMSWADIERLNKTYGVNVLNHTHTHPHLGEVSEERVRDEFQKSTDILKQRGYHHDIMVYPYGSQNAMVRRVAREYSRAGIIADALAGAVAKPPIKTFEIPRKSLMFAGEHPMESLATFTREIDKAIAENGWVIFMSHSQFPTFDAEKIKALIDYANSVDIEWVYASEGLDRIGNIIDSGESVSGLQTILDADGVLHANKSVVKGSLAKPITSYPTGTSIKETIFIADATGFPQNTGGTLETYRGPTDDFSYQLYHIYNSRLIYKRLWDTFTKTWNEFRKIASHSIGIAPEGVFTRSVAEYENNTNTTQIVLIANATGFPDNNGGTLETFRSSQDVFSYQLYYIYNSNAVYKRFWNGSGWSAFEKLNSQTALAKTSVHAISHDFSDIGANSRRQVKVSVAGVTADDVVHVNFKYGLAFGVIPFAFVSAPGEVSINLENVTAATVTVGSRPITIGVIKP